jgi:hypothetical protein
MHAVTAVTNSNDHFTTRIKENKTKYTVTPTYEHRRNAGDLRIGNKTFEAVQSFQCLGNIVGNTNSNNECIKERIVIGNKAYYANRQLVNSSLIYKKQPVADILHVGTSSGYRWLRIVVTHRGRG